jgi:hypothetical protein
MTPPSMSLFLTKPKFKKNMNYRTLIVSITLTMKKYEIGKVRDYR